jgi:TolB-like protein
MSLWAELKRRNVFRVGAAYAVVAWLLLQAADVLLGNFGAPDWVFRSFAVLLILGFPLALFLSWAFELTPEGVKRSEDVAGGESFEPRGGRRIDRLILAGLLLVTALLVAERFRPSGDLDAPADAAPTVAESVATAPAVERVSVAVLPFVAMSRGEDDEFFADGLTEEIINALSRLPELLVTARTSAFHFKGKDVAIPEIARNLGVGYVLEGSVRRSGERLRITAQLIRAADGFHVWSQSYERDQADVFAIQDDIAQRVAAALDVLLDAKQAARMSGAGVRDIEAFIAFQKGMALYRDAHLDNVDRIALLRRANAEYDAALERTPDLFGAHLHRTDLYSHLLLDPAFGVLREPLDPAELAVAPTLLREGFDRAYASARLEAERNVVDAARTYLSTDWSGLDAAYRRLYTYTGCMPSMLFADRWMDFGGAAEMRRFVERQLQCDPYAWTANGNLAAIHNWLGDFDATLAVAARARDRLGLNVRVESSAFFALVGKRDYASARRAALSPAFEESRQMAYTAMVLAAEGRADEARTAVAGWHARFADLPLLDLPMAAWLGDRAEANAIAARLDVTPLGAAAVTDLIRACLCGAPFDLAAAPNFRSQLEASGLGWPPPSSLLLPLKRW